MASGVFTLTFMHPLTTRPIFSICTLMRGDLLPSTREALVQIAADVVIITQDLFKEGEKKTADIIIT